MAATRSSIGYLAAFAVGTNASPPVYTDMLELKSIKLNILTVPVIDGTHLKSPNATSEKIPGLVMPGTVEISGNFVADATQLQILTLAKARTNFPFKATAPVENSTAIYTLVGTGFVSKYDNGPFQPSTLGEFSMTIEISGDVTESEA